MSDYRQDPPNSLQVESVEGCNLRCVFCGLNGIRGKNTRDTDRFMTVVTAQRLAAQVKEAGWNPRVEFAMHGEPTLNRDLAKLILAFRLQMPTASIMLTTNGDPLRTDPEGFATAVDRLFSHGLNTIALDDYRGMKVAPLARAYAVDRYLPLFDYPHDPAGNPHHRWSGGARRITILQDIAVADKGTHSYLSNHAGSAAPLNHRGDGKRCALPFREISVRWDGSVALCCNDWTGMFKVGNINERSVWDIWHDPAMYAARKYLLQGKRVFRPCHGCDYITKRNGLLPDRMGHYMLPEPTAEDDALIKRALSGPSYTAPVQRPWERSTSLRSRALPVIQETSDE